MTRRAEGFAGSVDPLGRAEGRTAVRPYVVLGRIDRGGRGEGRKAVRPYGRRGFIDTGGRGEGRTAVRPYAVLGPIDRSGPRTTGAPSGGLSRVSPPSRVFGRRAVAAEVRR